MRKTLYFLGAAAIMAAGTFPALADSMTRGEGMMIMSDGTMATMTTMDAAASAMMMKHPMTKCVLMMMGTDGKMYMTTNTDKNCAAMAKAKM